MRFVLIIHRSKVLKKLTRTTLINLSTQKLTNLSTHQLKKLKLLLSFYNIALIFTPF